jgi:hypothetical protein
VPSPPSPVVPREGSGGSDGDDDDEGLSDAAVVTLSILGIVVPAVAGIFTIQMIRERQPTPAGS